MKSIMTKLSVAMVICMITAVSPYEDSIDATLAKASDACSAAQRDGTNRIII